MALISVWVPLIVKALEPSTPDVMVAPPLGVTLKLPCKTESEDRGDIVIEIINGYPLDRRSEAVSSAFPVGQQCILEERHC